MTDIISAGPIANRDTMRLPSFRPTRSISSAIATIARSVGEAFAMAYVAPYQGKPHRPAAPDAEPGGRDPRW